MKKLISLALALICLFCIAGCSAKTYELPWDNFCCTVEDPTDVPMSKEGKKYVIDLLNGAEWTDDTPNCGSDYIFYTKKQEVRYHSECGTFFDVTNKKGVAVSDEQKANVNKYLGINYFTGKVLEKYEKSCLIEVTNKGNQSFGVGDLITVNTDIESCPEYQKGDVLTVTFDGSVAESYPMQIHKVYRIVK